MKQGRVPQLAQLPRALRGSSGIECENAVPTTIPAAER